MNIKNIFIITTAFFSMQLAASAALEKKFDQERYIDLNRTFNEQNNTFIQEASNKTGTRSWIIDIIEPDKLDADIATIKQHKEQKEKELAERKFTLETSWKPVILKMLGGAFGISAASSVGTGTAWMLAGSGIIKKPSTFIKTFIEIVGYPRLITLPVTFPLTLPIMLTTSSIFSKLKELYENRDISLSQYRLGVGSTQVTIGLLFGGIAKYLFNKAASYANEIKEIEKIIDRDKKMIEVLEKLKEPKK